MVDTDGAAGSTGPTGAGRARPEPERPLLRLAAWGGAGLVVALVRNRVWATPNLAFFSVIADHLGSNPFRGAVEGDYLLTNLSGPVLARALGQTDPHAYARLHLVLAVFGLVAVIVAAHRAFGYRVARLLVVVVTASPALTVVMEWLGQPDALTLPLALGVVVARRRSTAFALAVALGLTHAEQGVIIALVATVARLVVAANLTGPSIIDERPDSRSPLWRHVTAELAPLLGGVIAGRVIVEVYLRLADIVVSKPRTTYLDLGFGGFVDHHLKSHGVIVYALWGPLWIGIAVAAVRFVRSGRAWPTALRRQWSYLGATALMAVVPMLVTLDETRVYSLTTAPLLVAAVVLARRTLDAVPAARLTTLDGRTAAVAVGVGALALAAVPGLFTAGETYVATDLPASEFVRFLRDGEHPGDLTAWLLGPFGFEVPTPQR